MTLNDLDPRKVSFCNFSRHVNFRSSPSRIERSTHSWRQKCSPLRLVSDDKNSPKMS